MADIIQTPTRNSQIIERVKRELVRRANDKLKVYNPTDKDFVSSWDGFAYTVKAKAETELLRYMAQHYMKHMIDHLIGLENLEKVKAENDKRLKSGQKIMDPQEREVFDLRGNDENLRRKYMAVVYKGLTEHYGATTLATQKAAVADMRPLDERLLDEIDKQVPQEETPAEPEPLKVDDEDFDEGDFDIKGVESKKEDLSRSLAE